MNNLFSVIRVVIGVIVVKVDVSASVSSGGGGSSGLGESGRHGDNEGLDEVGESEEEGDVANEGSGSTSVDEVRSSTEGGIVRPFRGAEPGTTGHGTHQGAELGTSTVVGQRDRGQLVAVGEGLESLGHE